MMTPNLFQSRGPSLPPPDQFLGTVNAIATSNQPSMLMLDSAKQTTYSSDCTHDFQGPGEHSFPRPFQPAQGNQTPPNIMFQGPTNSSTPIPRGFMPVSAPRAPLTQQQPNMITPGMQPQSPSSLSPPRAQPVPAVAAPPVTIQTVETTNVPGILLSRCQSTLYFTVRLRGLWGKLVMFTGG